MHLSGHFVGRQWLGCLERTVVGDVHWQDCHSLERKMTDRSWRMEKQC